MTHRILATAMLAAGMLAAGSQSNDRDLKEIRDYRLSMDNIQRFLKAFQTITKDPATNKCMNDNPSGNGATLDASQKLLEACPAAMAAIKAQGLKPREFLILTGAIIGDFMAVSMKKAGQIKDYPPSISPENVAFIEQNFDKLQAMTQQMMSSGGK